MHCPFSFFFFAENRFLFIYRECLYRCGVVGSIASQNLLGRFNINTDQTLTYNPLNIPDPENSFAYSRCIIFISENKKQRKFRLEMATLRGFNKILCCFWGFLFLSFSAYAEVLKNPAIASKCKRMALKRVNGLWESTKIPSACLTDSDEEAARLCKEVSLILIKHRRI